MYTMRFQGAFDALKAYDEMQALFIFLENIKYIFVLYIISCYW